MHEVKYEVVPIFYEKNKIRQSKIEAKLRLEALNQKYDLYLETNKNQLFDWSTSLYIAKKKFSAQKDTPNISYETKNFVSCIFQFLIKTLCTYVKIYSKFFLSKFKTISYSLLYTFKLSLVFNFLFKIFFLIFENFCNAADELEKIC